MIFENTFEISIKLLRFIINFPEISKEKREKFLKIWSKINVISKIKLNSCNWNTLEEFENSIQISSIEIFNEMQMKNLFYDIKY